MKSNQTLEIYNWIYQALVHTPLELIQNNEYEYTIMFEEFYKNLYLITAKFQPVSTLPKNYTL